MEAIKLAYAQALLVDRVALEEARNNNDVVTAQEILQNAFRTDLRPLLAEARLRVDAALNPVGLFREQSLRKKLIETRGMKAVSTGL